jgi:hypothetical protein
MDEKPPRAFGPDVGSKINSCKGKGAGNRQTDVAYYYSWEDFVIVYNPSNELNENVNRRKIHVHSPKLLN